MLTGTENKVMSAIYEMAKDKEALLISPTDLMKIVDLKADYNGIEKTVTDLSMDGYFDLIYSDRNGEKVYCISLTEKGKAFSRNKKVQRRNVLFRVGFTVGLAVLSFVVGLILKAIF